MTVPAHCGYVIADEDNLRRLTCCNRVRFPSDSSFLGHRNGLDGSSLLYHQLHRDFIVNVVCHYASSNHAIKHKHNDKQYFQHYLK